MSERKEVMLYIKDDCLYQENTRLGNIKTVSIFPFDLIEEWSPVQIRPSKETYQYYFSIKVNNVALLNQNVERTDFMEHLRICTEMDELEKLSSTFMTLPVHSNNDNVWTDVNRMNTLNTIQANTKKEKHICPLQFDIIERLINRFSMKGESVFDPFGGLFSVAYKALEMERKAVSIELNSEYFHDGLHYIKSMILKMDAPKLFDFIENI